MTNGELEKPHSGVFVAVSEAAFRDQTTDPSRESRAFRMPVAPNV